MAIYKYIINDPSLLQILLQNPTVHLDRHFSLTLVIQSVATFTIADGL